MKTLTRKCSNIFKETGCKNEEALWKEKRDSEFESMTASRYGR
jgi:hypothetical protein